MSQKLIDQIKERDLMESSKSLKEIISASVLKELATLEEGAALELSGVPLAEKTEE